MLYSLLSRLSDLIYRLTWNRITPRFLGAALLLTAVMLLPGIRAVRHGHLRGAQFGALLSLGLYMALLLGATVICRRTRASYSYILRPFWTYDAPYILSHYRWGTIVRNCLMLLPFGFLLSPALAKPKLHPGWIVLSALGLSYVIEVLQLVLKRGTFELVDDPLHNLLGALVGWALFRLGAALFTCLSSSPKSSE